MNRLNQWQYGHVRGLGAGQVVWGLAIVEGTASISVHLATDVRVEIRIEEGAAL